ncbi:MAG: NAD(P)H-dependent glycerol-3-phosphate dehydrogenase [Calditrichaceae bacterium]|nr:NAD(P)H-dependent glycerol-3-phosphate dehydrogenase [Calditrichaceae bacterium]MBN2708805.1 NAD(P)H-dependent glycerol-3-phosphate dehydrogenase [Calditrichaceae bacterium]RQV97666.1 MAG: NAD(P)H-dependent glycerol-3-phosphate dehydrogenase [Calditrichota bacterium]
MKTAIIGTGSWGTALSLVLNQNGHRVTCWTIEEDVLRDIKEKKENIKYLPGVKVPESVIITGSLEESLLNAEMIVLSVPSQVTGQVVPKIKEFLKADQDPVWVSVAKGIENKTYRRISRVIEETGQIPAGRIGVLSGPSHAEEVGRKIPTAIVSASSELQTARLIQSIFKNTFFRVYASDDITGVELGGALKNIIALAAGICDGAGFGDNTKAALMTRGLAEIKRLGVKLGANEETFAGLSGMGDLIVTCMSRHSRNRYVGEQIGKGKTLDEVLAGMVMVAEGVKTTVSAYELSIKHEVEMPITEQIYLTMFENKPAYEAMIDLMSRSSKIENWDK